MRISDWSSDVCSSDLGDVQVMTAGTGIMHSEWNAEDDLTHLFQIWIEPRQRNLTPRWDQAQFPKGEIGRASCRERVCQSVSISVVAGTFKTKHTDQAA